MILEVRKLESQVEAQQKKVGAFNALFAVGGFLPAVGDSEAGALLAEYVKGARQAPRHGFRAMSWPFSCHFGLRRLFRAPLKALSGG